MLVWVSARPMAHDAVEALWKGLMEMRDGWVVDLDISKFFDSLDHRKLREILDTRVRDGVIRKAIDTWVPRSALLHCDHGCHTSH